MKTLHCNSSSLHELAALSSDAIAVIRNILTSENASDTIKLRAAKMVLDAAAAIQDGAGGPEPAGAPEPVKIQNAAAKTAAGIVIEIPANQPAISTKICRNETCPCGSGIKYKKCCLNKPLDTPQNRALALAA